MGLNSHERRAILGAAIELHELDELRGDFDIVPGRDGWRLSSYVTGRKSGKVVYATMFAFDRGADE